ncbi:MAG: LamG-like jellyroll fold domain-containing protein [bacterium]
MTKVQYSPNTRNTANAIKSSNSFSLTEAAIQESRIEHSLHSLFLILLVISSPSQLYPFQLNRSDTSSALVWRLADLPSIIVERDSLIGNPAQIASPFGTALQFNGAGDAIFLDCNPLKNLYQFTIEVIFQPDSGGKSEQRFLHIGEVRGKRVLLETRLIDNRWCLDAYVKSGDSLCTLIDRNLLHPTDRWYHVALTVDNGRMTTYINGRKELEGTVPFQPLTSGRTSIGVRQNRVDWFKGAIYLIKISPTVVTPDRFIKQRNERK